MNGVWPVSVSSRLAAARLLSDSPDLVVGRRLDRWTQISTSSLSGEPRSTLFVHLFVRSLGRGIDSFRIGSEGEVNSIEWW
jgi:hypothetical protein